MLINNDTIKFIETHLDFSQGKYGADYRKMQVQELIEATKDVNHAIICADFNISNVSEYDSFKDSGWLLANCGDWGIYNTYPANNPASPIDNIIVKGLNIRTFEVINHPNLSDHVLLKCTLSFE